MKLITCYDCSETFTAPDRAAVLSQLYDHYMKEHTATITGASATEKTAWMQRFEADWNNAPTE